MPRQRPEEASTAADDDGDIVVDGRDDRRATVRFRSVLWVAGLLAVALGSVGVIAVQAVRSSLVEQLDEQLRAASAIPSAASPTGPLPVPTVEGMAGDPEVLELVFGSDGRLRRFVQQPDVLPVLPVIPSNEAAALAGQIYTAPAEDGHSTYRVLISPAPDGGARVLAISANEVDRTVHAVERAVIVSGALAFVLALTVVWWVLRRGLRPLARLADDAERVVGAHGGDRVGGADDRSEVARVAAVLDTSLDRLDAEREERRRAEASAGASERQLREFIAGAARELRAPAEVLERDAADIGARLASGREETSDGVRVAAEEIESSAAALLASIDELGWLSEPERVPSVLQEAVDLALVLPELVHDVALAHPDRSMVVDVHAGIGQGAIVLGDEDGLRHAIVRVLTRACARETSALPIEVGLRAGDHEVEVVVADHADDLDPEDAAAILRPFYRSRPAPGSSPTPTDAGLFVPAAIVRRHGGDLTLARTPGGGVTVTLALPTLAATAARQRAAHDLC